MSKTTSQSAKSNTSNEGPRGPFSPFSLDPASILDAQRQAALTGIEGLLTLQIEMRKAFESGLGRVRAETETWATLSHELASEGVVVPCRWCTDLELHPHHVVGRQHG